LEFAGYPIELLIWDNGSDDLRIQEYISNLKPTYLRLFPENIGYAPACNQLFLRAKGDWICMLDPDIKLPHGWLVKLVEANQKIQNSGISSWHCIEKLHHQQVIEGMTLYPGDVFGCKFFSRKLLETVGYYSEDYGKYGLEDRCYLYRTSKLGYLNYYVGTGSEHMGNDVGDVSSTYRQMKWRALEEAGPKMQANIAKYDSTKNYYVAPPELL
jgi:glycosyltransferase involved in cell wall biosynthesis